MDGPSRGNLGGRLVAVFYISSRIKLSQSARQSILEDIFSLDGGGNAVIYSHSTVAGGLEVMS